MPDPVDDLLPGAPPVAAPPSPVPLRAKITCEFCECQLAPSGEYLRLSDRAKAIRGLEEKIETLGADLELARVALATAARERDDARAQVTAATGKKDIHW
jgi:hypothetical protein